MIVEGIITLVLVMIANIIYESIKSRMDLLQEQINILQDMLDVSDRKMITYQYLVENVYDEDAFMKHRLMRNAYNKYQEVVDSARDMEEK